MLGNPSYLANLNHKLYQLRKLLLEKFIERLESPTFTFFIEGAWSPSTSNTGLKSIPFFQTLLSLMTDLSGRDETDKILLDRLIRGLLNNLKPLKNATSLDENNETKKPSIYIRSGENEIKLIILRTISILLSKSKYQRSGENCNFIIQTLLHHLCEFNIIEVCLNLLKYIFFEHWKKLQVRSDHVDEVLASGFPQNPTETDSCLIKFNNEFKYYDELTPYFVRDSLNKDSFVVPVPNLSLNSDSNTGTNPTAPQPPQPSQPSNSNPSQQQQASTNGSSTSKKEIMDNYTELLSEIVIRLPYQIKKLCLGVVTSSTSTQTASSTTNIDSQSAQYQANLNSIADMFDFASWTHYLCEYLLVPHCHYLKRLIKKLLQILCGSKVKIISSLSTTYFSK